VVRARLEGVFPTYKTLADGTRRTYWYHRATGKRLHGEPGSAEFIAAYAAAEKTIRDRTPARSTRWCAPTPQASSSSRSSPPQRRLNTGAC
jgi:hypothetical protein